jgi:hypothetical protein
VEPLELDVGDYAGDYEEQDDYDDDIARLQRSIEFGVGNVQLQPENCVNHISEPTRAIAEIRTLVCADVARETMTFVDQTQAYMDRKGRPVVPEFPAVVMVPLLPVNNLSVESNFAFRLDADDDEQLHLELFPEKVETRLMDDGFHPQDYNNWVKPDESYAALLDGTGNPAPLPYTVGYVRIGRGNPVQVRLKGDIDLTPWDGRVPYVYNKEIQEYEFDGPVTLHFSNFRCTSDGTLHSNLVTGGSDDQKKTYNEFGRS